MQLHDVLRMHSVVHRLRSYLGVDEMLDFVCFPLSRPYADETADVFDEFVCQVKLELDAFEKSSAWRQSW